MSAIAVFGLILYIAVAAAFAVFWHRVWRLGTLPSVVAAICSAVAALALDFVTTGQLSSYALPIFGVLFALAWVVSIGVQMATRSLRAKESAIDA